MKKPKLIKHTADQLTGHGNLEMVGLCFRADYPAQAVVATHRIKSTLRRMPFLGLCILIFSCQPSKRQDKMEATPIFEERFIQNREVKLHYLDWGGSGQPLVLIHGLGDSPYIFEDIAAILKNDFRVIAYSRRGHGKSSTPDAGYDNSSLTSDLKLLLDSLKIERANLLGWSMGGNEITEFAKRFPERTSKLIYLEGGYDYSEEGFKSVVKSIPESPFPDRKDLLSLDAYKEWYHAFWFADVDWNPALEANLNATTQVNLNKSVTTIPNDIISKMLLESLMSYHREYENIQAPALAIYTNQFFHSPLQKDSLIEAYNTLENKIVKPWRQQNIDRIKRELKNVTVKEAFVGSHTSIIFLSRDTLVKSITDFLLN
jgi:pimeloyl-ACP methyl ester carboxylesterase